MRPSASATAVGDPGSLAPYWRFHRAVAEAQLASWLPHGRHLLVDISGPRARAAHIAATAGHTVLRVAETAAVPPNLNDGFRAAPARDRKPGQVVWLASDPGSLSFLADGCADGVIAEDRTLSRHLAAETLIADVARVLRPAGQVLASVDSLVLGMALLAEQRHWAELTDLPNAEVVLVPWPDGTITRCFGADHLRELFDDAGLTVAWIRPRTVFSPSTVAHVLRRDPSRMRRLVEAELAARPDESVGVQLVVSARKRGLPQRRRRSCFPWQATHRAASGRASRRPSGTGFAQSTHSPYVPSSIRRSAADTLRRCPCAESRTASVRSVSERLAPASAGSSGYASPGSGLSPLRTAIDRSRPSSMSSSRLRAIAVSTEVLASSPPGSRLACAGGPGGAGSKQRAFGPWPGRGPAAGRCHQGSGIGSRLGDGGDEGGPVVRHRVDGG